jgi:hypothetical protein
MLGRVVNTSHSVLKIQNSKFKIHLPVNRSPQSPRLEAHKETAEPRALGIFSADSAGTCFSLLTGSKSCTIALLRLRNIC